DIVSGDVQGTTFANVNVDGTTQFYVSGVDFTGTNTGGVNGSDLVLTPVNPTDTFYVDADWTSTTVTGNNPFGLTNADFGVTAFTDIQAAITAAISGDLIVVCGNSSSYAAFATGNKSLLFQTVVNPSFPSNSSVILPGAVTIGADTAFSLSTFGAAGPANLS